MCIIIFITIFGNILFCSAGKGDDSIYLHGYSHRIKREGPIVQPDWIPSSEMNLFQDFNVRVTDRKLEETEAIRDYIKETVDNDTYVVELDENDFEEDELQSDEEGRIDDLPEPEPELEIKPNTPQPQYTPTPQSVPEQPQQKNTPSTAPPKIHPSPTNSSNRRRLFSWFSKRFNRF